VQTTSLLGISPSRTLVTALIPIGLFSLVGISEGLYALVAVIYATGEEFGWRGFLADTLAPLRWPWSLGITSVLWWFWHLRFTTTFDLLLFLPIIVVSSLALGHAARTSGSVLVAAAMHALIIVLTANGAPSRPMIFAGVATLVAWILLGVIWPETKQTALEADRI
jgi:membrane protease YdiL (CAAX protease family)